MLWRKQDAHPPKSRVNLGREKGAHQQVTGDVLVVAQELYVLTRAPLLGEHLIGECHPVECPHGPRFADGELQWSHLVSSSLGGWLLKKWLPRKECVERLALRRGWPVSITVCHILA